MGGGRIFEMPLGIRMSKRVLHRSCSTRDLVRPRGIGDDHLTGSTRFRNSGSSFTYSHGYRWRKERREGAYNKEEKCREGNEMKAPDSARPQLVECRRSLEHVSDLSSGQ